MSHANRLNSVSAGGNNTPKLAVGPGVLQITGTEEASSHDSGLCFHVMGTVIEHVSDANGSTRRVTFTGLDRGGDKADLQWGSIKSFLATAWNVNPDNQVPFDGNPMTWEELYNYAKGPDNPLAGVCIKVDSYMKATKKFDPSGKAYQKQIWIFEPHVQ